LRSEALVARRPLKPASVLVKAQTPDQTVVLTSYKQ
jgi:hypothetical protein